MLLARSSPVHASFENWEGERRDLLSRRISDLGLTIEGSLVERLVAQLYEELDAKGLAFKPPVYLSDQWGCPDGTALIGVPFYLADPRLARIEEEVAVEVEEEREVMRYLRHEAGHAFNYAYRFYDRAEWPRIFGPFSRPYRDRYHADPFSRAFVRHILGWYAQKHPDEDFAETFAVWLTPGSDWQNEYAGWPVMAKLEYVDALMKEVGSSAPELVTPTEDDLPVESMHYTIEDHYRDAQTAIPIEDERHFDGELRSLFVSAKDAPQGEDAAAFLHRHRREVVARIAYWTGEGTPIVRQFIDLLATRAEALQLRVNRLEASTLIELTAFGTAVVMNYRYTESLGSIHREET